MTMITESDIARFAHAGACDEALAWLREAPRSDEDVPVDWTWWALRAPGLGDEWLARLSDARLDAIAAAAPGEGLWAPEHVVARLSDARLDAAAPGAALWTRLRLR